MRSTKIIKICSSSLCTCLHHMVILRTRNKITDFLMILAWASPFKKPIQECHYYSDSNLTKILSEQSNMFSIPSLNIQSLNAKFDQLHIFVQQLRQSNHEFSAICLQESWLSNVADISLYQLEGYTLIMQGKTCSQHGGLVIYLNNKYN